MSEAEVITACENVCRDFPFFSQLGEWVSSFGPAITFLGAIWLFFLQRKADRSEALKARRLEVYQEAIATFRDVTTAIRFNSEVLEIGLSFKQFELSYAKILVSGIDEVIEVTTNARASLIDFMEAYASDEQERITRADAETERLFLQCIDRMRQDMHLGTELTSEYSSDEVGERIRDLILKKGVDP
ncbi:hypothetical protein K3740_01020 [Ruegeria conchae]|uniref:hypothetical protein n=1 Tax=Ruegeria conchae TaxID=981384 RepID=UPI0014816A3F|nr:hypothetical protein [Ruegeria conchae]UWR03324.1 hypothetical protein K3740_01020 [Ruegeria conchae]